MEAEDVLGTGKASWSKLWASPYEQEGDQWVVTGRGIGGLTTPSETRLILAIAGTGTRLMMGVVGGNDIESCIWIGDLSLVTKAYGARVAAFTRNGRGVLSESQ